MVEVNSSINGVEKLTLSFPSLGLIFLAEPDNSAIMSELKQNLCNRCPFYKNNVRENGPYCTGFGGAIGMRSSAEVYYPHYRRKTLNVLDLASRAPCLTPTPDTSGKNMSLAPQA